MDTYEAVKEICLALPEATEEYKIGRPHFCVRRKIFCGIGTNKIEHTYIGFKLDSLTAHVVTGADERFTSMRHLGQYSWVEMDIESVSDWGEVADYIKQSYCLIAPKILVKQLRRN